MREKTGIGLKKKYSFKKFIYSKKTLYFSSVFKTDEKKEELIKIIFYYLFNNVLHLISSSNIYIEFFHFFFILKFKI